MAKPTGTEAHRDRILKAALDLLSKQGRDAVTTRSVAEAARVQPTVLYRIFGDKAGLLQAVATYGFTAYLTRKRPPATSTDPVEALRTGWDLHVEFGLQNPELYLLMYADPRPGPPSQAAQQSFNMLHEHMQHVAIAGRLSISVEKACILYHAAAVGIMMSFLACTTEQRDLSLSVVVRDHALSSITSPSPTKLPPTIATMTSSLRALLTKAGMQTRGFTEAEKQLLLEWLKRLTEQQT